jgi:hypothetical protein
MLQRVITRSDLPNDSPRQMVFSSKDVGVLAGWREHPGMRTYRKKVLTRMVRVEGPFTVQTSEGPLECIDGFLAVDARGYPYPIDAQEQALIYEEVQP